MCSRVLAIGIFAIAKPCSVVVEAGEGDVWLRKQITSVCASAQITLEAFHAQHRYCVKLV